MESAEKLQELKQKLKEINAGYAKISQLTTEEKVKFGQEQNRKKQEILSQIEELEKAELDKEVEPIDVTAFSGVNEPLPELYSAEMGSRHPLMTELDRVIEIYQMMGFDVMESRQLDDEFHMFDSLNFAKEHPARDGYDTFRTEEGLIPPAHTSTMQHRVLKKYKSKLDEGKAIAVVVRAEFLEMRTWMLRMSILFISVRAYMSQKHAQWVICWKRRGWRGFGSGCSG